MTGDEYMKLLEQRRDAWEAAHPAREALQAQIDRIKQDFPGANPVIRPDWKPPVALLEWFIEPGDEDLVTLPEPAPKRKPQPRVYRSAASLREERDRVQAQLDAIHGRDCGDNAVVNLSPYSRSRAARNAGRRRFAQLDRDLERAGKLTRRIQSLDFRITKAEAREERNAPSAPAVEEH